MAKTSKRMALVAQKIDREKMYPVAEAIALVKECATAKFDESIDIAVQLGIDPKNQTSSFVVQLCYQKAQANLYVWLCLHRAIRPSKPKQQAQTLSVWKTLLNKLKVVPLILTS